MWPALPSWAQEMEPVARFAAAGDPLTITRPVQSHKPFTVAGPLGAILGEQNGGFEAWVWPVKIFSRFAITAELEDYAVPIELAPLASTIEVRPPKPPSPIRTRHSR
jgi:hypothetical protein